MKPKTLVDLACTRNPAAIAALAQGDMENFLVAATSGGIEAQEAAGQAELCQDSLLANRARLPLEWDGEHRDPGRGKRALEERGVIFGEPTDEIFQRVILPDGWELKATEHSMWSGSAARHCGRIELRS